MAGPGVYNFTIYQRARFYREITYRDADDVVVNLSAHTAVLEVRDSGDNLIVRLSTSPSAGEGTITLDATAPNIIWAIADDDTQDLPANQAGTYDFVLIDAAGEVDEPLLTGAVPIRKAIVHP